MTVTDVTPKQYERTEMEQATEFIKIKKVGRIVHMTIDHPPMNTISIEILQELVKLVTEAGSDDAVRAILLDSANQEMSLSTEILLYFASRA